MTESGGRFIGFLAVGSGVAAVAALAFLAPARLGDGPVLLLLLAPVLAGSALGGVPAGLAAVALALVASIAISARRGTAPEPFALASFAFIALGICLRGEMLARGQRRIRTIASELRQREAHLQSILDTVPDAMIVIDEQGVMQSFSAAAERLFGWTAAEAIGPQRQHADAVALSRGARRLSRALPRDRRAADHRHRPRRGRASARDGSTFPMELAVGEMRTGGAAASSPASCAT